MSTVFSYIVQKRLSQEYENVATEALAFIVNSSEGARTGLMKMLHGIAPELPLSLRFDTQHSFDSQQTEGRARPDMWGFDGAVPRVFIENKFWAGLTPNQPVEYLREIAGCPNPAVLLMVVPEARLETVWRECDRLLHAASVPPSPRNPSAGVHRSATICFIPALAINPILAITSWAKLLSAIDAELTDEPRSRNDLSQLRSLCDAADAEYAPFSLTELTDQRIPTFVRQLTEVMQRAVDVGVTAGILSIRGLMPQSNWERQGRYIRFPNGRIVDAWIGTDFSLWQKPGPTPIWLTFSAIDGTALVVRPVLEPWAEGKRIKCWVKADGSFSVCIGVVAGEERDHVVGSIVDQLRAVAVQLSALPAKPDGTP